MSESANFPNGSENKPSRSQIDRRTFLRDISLLSFLALAAPAIFKACVAPSSSPTPPATSSPVPNLLPTPTASSTPSPVLSPSPTQSPTQTTPTSPSAGTSKLPNPITSGNSVEICLNSRYSEHNLTGIISTQQIANILSAAGKAPVTGSSRDINASTPNGFYTFDPATGSLKKRADSGVSGGAFKITGTSNPIFDTGVVYMLAILASVSLWKSSEKAVASCPQNIDLSFGVQSVNGLSTELVARCSAPQNNPGYLPDPSTTGQNAIETVLANMHYTNQFSQKNLTLQQISQLLWAGYGCTPHVPFGGRKGLTVPSAVANYYLTGTIYLMNETGVFRYINRNPKTDLTTRDHRLEPVSAGDMRDALQTSVSGLPQAPGYAIICLGGQALTNSEPTRMWVELETGFVGAGMLIQASAMGLGCHFETNLTAEQKTSIQKLSGIPSAESPNVIISLGTPK
jgi:hypothetical protein